MTATELEFYKDMQLIRPYWDIGRGMITTMRDNGNFKGADAWEDYLDSSVTQRDRMKNDPNTMAFIGTAEDRVRDEREYYRLQHPAMEAVYVKWGFITNAVRPEAQAMARWLRTNAAINEETHARQLDAMQQGR